MWPTSDLFGVAIRGSHVAVVEISASFVGEVPIPDPVPITDGTINIDRSALVRRTLTLTVPGRGWVPHIESDPLSPFGGELTIRAGIRYPDGTVETVPVGVFRIQSAQIDLDAGSVQIAGSDRMQACADYRFPAPWTTPTSSSTWDVIQDLIVAAVPDATFRNHGVTDQTLRAGAVFDTSRGDAISELATRLGAHVAVDPDGVFALHPTPDLAAAPVATIDAGTAGILTAASSRLTRDQVYNAVIARGDSTDPDVPPVSAMVTDDDPRSPTRWGGPFGFKPRFYASPVITTVGQAQSAAAKILLDATGRTREVSLAAVPNPALDVGDVIAIGYPDGAQDRHILQTVTMPLRPGGDWSATTISSTYVAPAESGQAAAQPARVIAHA